MLTRLLILTIFALAREAAADTVTFSGSITQSNADGLVTSVNNPSLNNVADGDRYFVTLAFSASLPGPGTCYLSSGTLAFIDPNATATENSFNSISLTLIPDGSFFDLSLLGCLTTGSACDQGNQLDLNFQILASQLHSPTPNPVPIPGLLPFELLEDDGVTDIHGSVTNIPEPIQIAPLIAAMTALLCVRQINF